MSLNLVKHFILIATILSSHAAKAELSAEEMQHEAKIVFSNMSDKEQASFLKKRILFLELTEKALTKMKWAIGPVAVFQSKRKYEKLTREKYQIEKLANTYDDGTKQDILVNLAIQEEKLKTEYRSRSQITRDELSQELIKNIITAFDQKLWQQAPIVAESNEFGGFMAGGLMIEGGQPHKGYGGLIDIGISLGFNWEEKALAIQIITDVERYRSTILPSVFLAGAVGKGGFYIANQKQELKTTGTSFYPAFFPGFSSTTPNSFTSGLSSGFTIPPSPLGDVLTYENYLNKHILLRLTISPFTKGFVRIKTLLNKSSLDFLIVPFKKLLAPTINSCPALFN
ncbi:MAG: hypothetical protein H7328_05115 [Bdellovibrio sp.]|nr:hypothetical protein [Bdellovibrio sp.]